MSDSPILDRAPVGNLAWMVNLTGWSKRKVNRLCNARLIPGAYRPHAHAHWSFEKRKVHDWFERLQPKGSF